MNTPLKYSSREIVSMLSAALGDEMATKLVDDTAGALGISGGQFSETDAVRILERLSQSPGLVGITGRVSLTRIRRNVNTSVHPGSRAPVAGVAAGAPEGAKRRPIAFFATLLGPSMGDDKAASLIREIAIASGFSGDSLSLPEAISVFERLAERPGVVGIAARFAKTRLHLSF